MNKAKVLIIVAIGALVAAFFAFDLGHYFTLGYFKSQQAAIAEYYAAHALATDLTLVTDNVGEFSRVPGLAVENWLAS